MTNDPKITGKLCINFEVDTNKFIKTHTYKRMLYEKYLL